MRDGRKKIQQCIAARVFKFNPSLIKLKVCVAKHIWPFKVSGTYNLCSILKMYNRVIFGISVSHISFSSLLFCLYFPLILKSQQHKKDQCFGFIKLNSFKFGIRASNISQKIGSAKNIFGRIVPGKLSTGRIVSGNNNCTDPD